MPQLNFTEIACAEQVAHTLTRHVRTFATHPGILTDLANIDFAMSELRMCAFLAQEGDKEGALERFWNFINHKE